VVERAALSPTFDDGYWSANSSQWRVRTNVLTFFILTDMLFSSRLAMRSTWDENKNLQNLRKHDVRFETAVLVFDDPCALRSVTSLLRMRNVG
jgi:Ribonuclease toxin, BrnT, of type II toxin-antitoxin system